jgi:hypothetical protein
MRGRGARNVNYKPRRCLNDISVLSKYRYGRTVTVGKAVIRRILDKIGDDCSRSTVFC